MIKLKIENVLGIRMQSGRFIVQDEGESKKEFIERIKQSIIKGEMIKKLDSLNIFGDIIIMDILKHREDLLKILDEKNYDTMVIK